MADDPFTPHTRRTRRNLVVVASLAILFQRVPELTPRTIPGVGIDLAAGGENLAAGVLTLVSTYLLVSFVFNAFENYIQWKRKKVSKTIFETLATEFRWPQIAERYMRWRYQGFVIPEVYRFRNIVRRAPPKVSWRDLVSTSFFAAAWLRASQRVLFSPAVLHPVLDIALPTALGVLGVVGGWTLAYPVNAHDRYM